MSAAQSNAYDLIIVGGGLVGASLACALSTSCLRIALIESHLPGTASQPSFDDRSVALSWGSRKILEAMGLWSALAAQLEAIKTIHISDRGHFGVTRLSHDAEGVAALGYVAENRVLGTVLYAALHQASNVTVFTPASVAALNIGAQHVTVSVLQADKTLLLCARLLVAADGVDSTVRKLLHIESSRQDYQQSALISNVATEYPHRNVAYERFTATGPLALLPMLLSARQSRCALVWTLPPDDAQAMLQLNDAQFLHALQQRFGYRLGSFRRVGARHVYPLALVEASQVVRGRVVVVGNAAHSLHPVAGQGFNLALRDIALLAELLVDSEDAGAAALLEHYASARQQDAERVYRFTDSLVKLFSNDFAPLAHARAAGLCAVDLMPPLKHHLARLSMGLAVRVSRLGCTLALQRTPR